MSQGESYHKLSDSEIESEVTKLQGWKVVNGKLSKSFEFKRLLGAKQYSAR